MDASDVKPGTVLRFPHDARPNRVLLHQDDVVMFDAWWPHLDGWGLANLKEVKRQRISYYLTTLAAVLQKAAFVRLDPLSVDEWAVHRPDLPFVAVQDTSVTWSIPSVERATEARSELNAPRIWLLPFGPGGGTKAGVQCVADNGSYFTSEELLRKAQAAQAPHLSDVMPVSGVGIYRYGLLRGLPSFYLWGAVSRLHDRQ